MNVLGESNAITSEELPLELSGGLARPMKLGAEVASQLRDLIFSGRLRPGSRLRLQDLAKSLGVSTTPIREALLVLEKEGLLESEQHRGFRVKRITEQDVRDIYELHATVASLLVERAAQHVSEEDLKVLRDLDATIRAAAQNHEVQQVEELNYEFHRLINSRAPDSELLRRFLRETTRYVPRRVYMEIEGWLEASAQDHSPILHALKDGDGRRAAEVTAAHIRKAGDLLIDHLRKSGVW